MRWLADLWEHLKGYPSSTYPEPDDPFYADPSWAP